MNAIPHPHMPDLVSAVRPRTGVLWVPDWPVLVASAVAGLEDAVPTVIAANRRVRVASGYARAQGVRAQMSLRAAQELCPDVHVLESNEASEAREFEYVAQVVERVVPTLDIIRPGLLTFGAQGPTRYFGSEDALTEALINQVSGSVQVEAHVGFAEGLLAAILSARTMLYVPPGSSPDFLAARPLADVLYATTTSAQRRALHELIGLWDRLGIRTFGQFARLPRSHVQTRFGEAGVWVHDLASGRDSHVAQAAAHRPDIEAHVVLDTPATRVDEAAFYARSLAQTVHDSLVEQSATCNRILVAAHLSDGSILQRSWRTDEGALGAMSPARLTQRVRWQLEGWLTNSALLERARRIAEGAGKAGSRAGGGLGAGSGTGPAVGAGVGSGAKVRPAGGMERLSDQVERDWALDDTRPVELTALTLSALDVIGAATHQEALWGTSRGGDLRALRAVERAVSLVGPQRVHALSFVGGRTYKQRIRAVNWDDRADGEPQEEASEEGMLLDALPSPGPTIIYEPAIPVSVLDPAGRPVRFNNRLIMSSPPYRLVRPRADGKGTDTIAIGQWAGPWPITTLWWQSEPQHEIYLQLIPEHEAPALLVVYRDGGWECEGTYD